MYEPPNEQGQLEVPQPIMGGRIIRNLNRIRRLASEWVTRFHLVERPGMSLFAEFSPLEPMLASVRSGRGRSYYLVPFGDRLSRTQAAMIVNAYTGKYEEAIVLPKDCFFKYMTKAEALKLSVEKFKVPAEWLSQPNLIFNPSVETPDRFFPVWHFSLQRDVYVTPRADIVFNLATTEEEFWQRL